MGQEKVHSRLRLAEREILTPARVRGLAAQHLVGGYYLYI